MAQQIKKKFISTNSVDGDKIKLAFGQILKGTNAQGMEIDLLGQLSDSINVVAGDLTQLASTQEQEIINLKQRVLELETDQDDFLFKKEKIAIQLEQDLTYVDLEYKAVPNTIIASIDRLMIYLNDDFEVSVVNNVTRITWIGPLHSLGDEKMGLGDILKVNYKISNSVFDSAPTPLILDDGLNFTLDNGDELIF